MLSRTRNRWLLIALLVLFGLPVLGATLVFNFAPDWRPWGTSNKGTLITPVRKLVMMDLSKDTASRSNAVWTLVYLSEHGCDEVCDNKLHDFQQIQIAMNKDKGRIARLFVGPPDATEASLQALADRYPGLATARASPAWTDAFSIDEQRPGTTSRVYLIDPKGYLMMFYTETQSGSDVYNDLRRLLKLSRAG